jgi:hypothetical protein
VPEKPRALLRVPRENTASRINRQIKEAEAFLPAENRRVTMEDLLAARQPWQDYTVKLLEALFTTDALSTEFKNAAHLSVNLNATPAERFNYTVERT